MIDYQQLNDIRAIEYIKNKTCIFHKNDKLTASLFKGNSQSVDGLCNVLIKIKSLTSGKSVVLKQVLPYVRALKDDGIFIPLTLERIDTEIYYGALLDKVRSGSVPKVLHWDKDENIVIMEDLSHMKILRSQLIEMKKFPFLSSQLGQLLGRSAFYTSNMFLNDHEKYALEHIFEVNNNGSIFIGLMFDDTFFDNSQRSIHPSLKKDIDDLCRCEGLINRVRILRKSFINSKDCLIHTDLHTSNIFVDEKNVKIFDGEYAHYGPAAYDVGRIIGSIILNYASLIGVRAIEDDTRLDYQSYLLDVIKDIYQIFENTYKSLCKKHQKLHLYDRYMKTMLEDTMGFAACVSISRIFDYGLTFDFKRIQDLEERAKAQRLVIEIGKEILLNNNRLKTVDQFIKRIQEVTIQYRVEMLIHELLKETT
jgi:5-methylthioribose kinase